MQLSPWQIWIIISVLLLIVEIFIPTFLAACISIGCIVAGFFSYFGVSIEVALVIFSIVTIASFYTVRPFMLKYAYKKSDKVKTNVEALEGKVGKVIVKIDASKNQGRISIDGDDWKAESINDEIIPVGERVEVLKIDSTLLIVKALKK